MLLRTCKRRLVRGGKEFPLPQTEREKSRWIKIQD